MEKIRTAVHEAAKDTLGDGKNPIKPWIRASTVRVVEERHRMERHRAQAAEENYKETSGTGSKKRMTKHSETWFMVRNIGHDTKKGNTKECSKLPINRPPIHPSKVLLSIIRQRLIDMLA